MSGISKEMFAQWKNDLVTNWVMEEVKRQRDNYVESLSNGAFTGDMFNKVVGRIQAYNDLLLIEWEE